MIRRDEVELVFSEADPTVGVRVKGVDVALLVLPGIELPRHDLYDRYWELPLPGADPFGPEGGVTAEGQFLLGTWRNRLGDGALEEFVRLHRGRWDPGVPSQSTNTPVQRTTSHELIVRQRLSETRFRELVRLCGGDPRDRFKPWAETFVFTPPPELFAAARAYASAEGLRFRTATTITVSYAPGPPTETADVGARGDGRIPDAAEFSLDERRLLAWLAAKAHDRPADAVTVGDLHSEALHEGLASDVRELVDAAILRQPAGWRLHVWPLGDSERWAYLVGVGASDEANDEGVRTFHVANGDDAVSSTQQLREQIEYVVDTANDLLPLARAARVGTDPHARHHPDGMCKAHSDYDCGEDDCQR